MLNFEWSHAYGSCPCPYGHCDIIIVSSLLCKELTKTPQTSQAIYWAQHSTVAKFVGFGSTQKEEVCSDKDGFTWWVSCSLYMFVCCTCWTFLIEYLCVVSRCAYLMFRLICALFCAVINVECVVWYQIRTRGQISFRNPALSIALCTRAYTTG